MTLLVQCLDDFVCLLERNDLCFRRNGRIEEEEEYEVERERERQKENRER